MNNKQKAINCLQRHGHLQPVKSSIDKLTALYLLFYSTEEEAIELYNNL